MSPKRVPDGGRITEPGEYVLTEDRRVRGVSPPSEAMIRIEADGVTLDGRGHAVVGDGVSDTTAIAAGGESTLADVVVENVGVEATGNSYGVLLERVAVPRLADCEIRPSDVYRIRPPGRRVVLAVGRARPGSRGSRLGGTAGAAGKSLTRRASPD